MADPSVYDPDSQDAASGILSLAEFCVNGKLLLCFGIGGALGFASRTHACGRAGGVDLLWRSGFCLSNSVLRVKIHGGIGVLFVQYNVFSENSAKKKHGNLQALEAQTTQQQRHDRVHAPQRRIGTTSEASHVL